MFTKSYYDNPSYNYIYPLLDSILDNSYLLIKYENKSDNTLLLNYVYEVSYISCCIIFNFPLLSFPMKVDITNNIEPTGVILQNTDNNNSISCLNIYHYEQPNKRYNIDKLEIIPCHFPSSHVNKGSQWENIFITYHDRKQTLTIIKYTLINIVNDSDVTIKGILSDKIIIDGIFNYKSGYWNYYKMSLINNNKQITFRSFDLTK